MARLTGPDESVRVVYLVSGPDKGKASAQGATAVIYTDATLTTPADIQSLAGVTVPASTVIVDAYSQLPLFLFPTGVDTVWTSVNGGPAVPLYARTDDRLDTLATRTTALEAGGASDALLVHRAGVEAITGVKTFSAEPVVPTPTQSTSPTTKVYVDAAGATITGNVSALGVSVAALQAVPLSATQAFTASGTWTNPSPSVARPVRIYGHSGGSGGGSGRRGAVGSIRGGGGGGAAGVPFEIWLMTTDLPATVPFTVGAGGAGGAAVITDDTDGAPGVSGGATFFGAASQTYRAGQTNSGAAGGRGGTSSGGVAGGQNAGTTTGGAASATGGAGGVAPAVFLTNGQGLLAATGGGAGGGVTNGDVTSIGGAGGTIASISTGGAGGAGGTTGTAGSAGAVTPVPNAGGFGGGGGGGGTTGGGGGGGAGAAPAGGGGGGGASLNGAASGAGGFGAVGYLSVSVFF